jgi:hypothetical protein
VRKTLAVFILGLGALGFLVTRPGLRLRAQSPDGEAAPWNPAAQQILIRYGVTDTAARTWRGWVEPVSGDAKVLGLSGYHFQNEDQVTA